MNNHPLSVPGDMRSAVLELSCLQQLYEADPIGLSNRSQPIKLMGTKNASSLNTCIFPVGAIKAVLAVSHP